LLSGVPILYGRDTGIDGYLDGLDVGVAVTIGDVADLARGLLTLAARAHLMRRAIRANYADLRGRFSPKPYLSHYAELVARIGADSPARFASVAG
jgi:hypothetical protein